ncbi:lipase 3-like [Pieris napi]|uniref:lipase 3-like n=1 Tax=Pieris napi TaxID=78633 RepID=UPI001FBBBF58|nr:lipase 3-like [Pieris napi]
MVRLRGFNLVLFLILIVQIRYSSSKKASLRDILKDFHDTLPKNNNNIIEQKLRNDGKINDDIYLNITQLITKYKYSVEVYEVITPDGYVIKLFRIPGNGAVVFLMHGLLSSADEWISGGVESGLAYLLAQLGYDVWMALGVVEIFQDSRTLRGLQRTFCGDMVWAFTICQHLIFIIGGFNYNQTNYEQLPVIYNHFPSGSSFKQIQHFAQLALSGDFRQFDYELKNFKKYGSLAPPSYPVEKITAPVAIFYGEGDWLCDISDVKILKSRLPNLVDIYRVDDDHFTHFDFVHAADTKNVLLANIIRLIKKIH